MRSSLGSILLPLRVESEVGVGEARWATSTAIVAEPSSTSTFVVTFTRSAL